MPEATQTDDLLEAIAKILLRCWIFGFILLLFWWGAVMLAGDLVFGVHGDMFDLTRPQLSVIHYCRTMKPTRLSEVHLVHSTSRFLSDNTPNFGGNRG